MNQELFRRSGRRDLFRYSEGARWKNRASYDAMMREAFEPYLPRMLYELHLYPRVRRIPGTPPFAELVAAAAKSIDRRIPVVAGGRRSRAFGRSGDGRRRTSTRSSRARVRTSSRARAPLRAGGMVVPLPGVTVHDMGYFTTAGRNCRSRISTLPDADFRRVRPLAAYDDADFGGGASSAPPFAAALRLRLLQRPPMGRRRPVRAAARRGRRVNGRRPPRRAPLRPSRPART
jgi:hypothetical protein